MGTEFNEERHEYRVDGVVVPSVTQVIGGVVPYNFYNATDWHLNRGRILHKAIALSLKGKLDSSSIDPAYEGKFAAFKKFMRDFTVGSCFKVEEMYFSPRFAGTVDAVFDIQGQLILVDWKGSLSPQIELQLGGYATLLDFAIEKAVGVELRDCGTYRTEWLASRPEVSKAKSLFASALNLYEWKRRHNLLSKEDTK
jgi:hypothetical protein